MAASKRHLSSYISLLLPSLIDKLSEIALNCEIQIEEAKSISS